jgi:hypothetical protein
VQRQVCHALGDGGARAWQERGPHPIGPGAEPQVEAGRLDLIRRSRTGEPDLPRLAIGGNAAGGQDALAVVGGVHRHHMAESPRLWQASLWKTPADQVN